MKNIHWFSLGRGELNFLFSWLHWNCSNAHIPSPKSDPNNDDDDDGWPQPHSPGPFVTLVNGKVTSNGQVGSPSQHCTETRKVRSFSVLFAAALVAKSGVFFFFYTLCMNLAPNSCQFFWELRPIDCRSGLLEQRFILDFTNSPKKIKFRNGFFLALAIAVGKRFSFVNGAELCMRDCAKRRWLVFQVFVCHENGTKEMLGSLTAVFFFF